MTNLTTSNAHAYTPAELMVVLAARALAGVRTVLTDRDTASVRLVVNPERLVIAEARRTATYLNLFGYRVDACFGSGCV